MTFTPPDDNDLIVGDDGAPGGVADLPGTPVEKADRVMPRVAEKIVHEDDGTTHTNEDIRPYFWGRAHHNLPGFVQPTRTAPVRHVTMVDGKEQVEIRDELVTDEAGRPRGLIVGEAGWIPNNEEGVQAVAVGFVTVEEPPDDVPLMPGEKPATILDL